MTAWEELQLLLAKVKNASGRIGIFDLLNDFSDTNATGDNYNGVHDNP